ncbi:transferase [Colletotrichum tofieldiae]|uniref:Transferase n=1 Tax=Colletotrichum tofieldiae TaxID=708197 RepID=A0A166V8R1_9PEZI|nr:transferase [Colletotrichum tofieldiae]
MIFILFKARKASQTVKTIPLNSIGASITTLLLSQTAFFSLGGSNSIGSIDIPNGYNGVKTWSAIGVPAQVIAANWAGSLWWACAGLTLLFASLQNEKMSYSSNKKSPSHQRAYLFHLGSLTLFRGTSILALMGSCLNLHIKRDPALWTKLAPSFVFTGVWSVFIHPFTNGIFCSCIYEYISIKLD